MDPQKIQTKLRELTTVLNSHSPFMLAFSGGLDSRLIAHTALKAAIPFTAVHIRGPHIPCIETEFAKAWLKKRAIPLVEIGFDPLGILEVAEGSKERCYACKREMFLLIQAAAKGLNILEGSNASDLTKFRPGLRAIKELGIISPLALAGISKPEARAIARASGLDQPEQPSRPCLLTRFDYGVYPSLDQLQKLEQAEAEIAKLGLKAFRLRLPKEEKPFLQVDWNESQLLEPKKDIIRKKLAWLGFPDMDFRLEIELSGYFDQGEESEEEKELKLLQSLF